MNIKTYKTSLVIAGDSLMDLIDTYLPKLEERSIVVMTSKIISLCEGSVVKTESEGAKKALIRESASGYLENGGLHSIQLTIKNNILIPSAGIDESNGNGFSVLYPKNIQKSAVSIREYLCCRDKVRELGILITDSHTVPMRRGVIGIGLGWSGFKALYSYIGKPDCFGVPLRVTIANHLDALATAAVFCMGEGNEQTPFAVINNAPKIKFDSSSPTKEEFKEVSVSIEEDLYALSLKSGKWVFKSGVYTEVS